MTLHVYKLQIINLQQSLYLTEKQDADYDGL